MPGDLGYVSYLVTTTMQDFLHDISSGEQTETRILADEGTQFATAENTADVHLTTDLTNLDQRDVFVHNCAPDRALNALANSLYWSGKDGFSGRDAKSQRADWIVGEGGLPVAGEEFNALSGISKAIWTKRAWACFGLFFIYMNLYMRSWRRLRRVFDHFLGEYGRSLSAGRGYTLTDAGVWRARASGGEDSILQDGLCKPLQAMTSMESAAWDSASKNAADLKCRQVMHPFWFDRGMQFASGDGRLSWEQRKQMMAGWDALSKDDRIPALFRELQAATVSRDQDRIDRANQSIYGMGIEPRTGSARQQQQIVGQWAWRKGCLEIDERCPPHMAWEDEHFYMNYAPAAASYWQLLFGKIQNNRPGVKPAEILNKAPSAVERADGLWQEECSLAEYIAKVGPTKMIRELRTDVLVANNYFTEHSDLIQRNAEAIKTQAAEYIAEQTRSIQSEQAGVALGTQLGNSIVEAGTASGNSYVMAAGAVVGAGSIIAGMLSSATRPRESICPERLDVFGDWFIQTPSGFANPRQFRLIDRTADRFASEIAQSIDMNYLKTLQNDRDGAFEMVPIFHKAGESRDYKCFENMAARGDKRARYVWSFFKDASYIRRRDRDGSGTLCPESRPFFYSYTDDTSGCHTSASMGCPEGRVASPHLSGRVGSATVPYDCVCAPPKVERKFSSSPDFPSQPAALCMGEGDSPCGLHRELRVGDRFLCRLTEEEVQAEIDNEIRTMTPDAWLARRAACSAPASGLEGDIAGTFGASQGSRIAGIKGVPAKGAKVKGGTPVEGTVDDQPELRPVVPERPQIPACPYSSLLTLMITPPGAQATVAIDGTMPVQVPPEGRYRKVVTPGVHEVVVTAGGQQVSRSVDARAGEEMGVAVTLQVPTRDADPQDGDGPPDDSVPPRREIEPVEHGWARRNAPWIIGGTTLVAVAVAVASGVARRAPPPPAPDPGQEKRDVPVR